MKRNSFFPGDVAGGKKSRKASSSGALRVLAAANRHGGGNCPAATRSVAPRRAAGGLRLGLCCQFANERIKFRTTTATAILRLRKRERLAPLAELCRFNVTDFPKEWLDWPLTVEVEAKAKELAVARLIADLNCERRLDAR